MNIALRTAIVAAATIVATPALAADAFTSFNGANGHNGFYFGYTDNTTFTVFNTSTTNGSCALGAGSICLQSSALGQLPQASIGGSYPTVTVPTNAILLHPGNAATQSVYSAFTAATTGKYSYTINLQSVGIDTTNGTGYTPFTSINGVLTLGTRGTLATYLSTGLLTGTKVLGAGDSVGVIVDYNGNYGGDSTGLNFSTTAVPEPATWAMMIAGFGMVGFGLRSRKRQVASVTYA